AVDRREKLLAAEALRRTRGGNHGDGAHALCRTKSAERALGEDARAAFALRDRARRVVHRSCGLVHRFRGRRNGLIFEPRADERRARRIDDDWTRRERGDRDTRVGYRSAIPAYGRGDRRDRKVERATIAQ